MVDINDMALAYSQTLTQRIDSFKLEITNMEEGYKEAREKAASELADLEAHLKDCLSAIENDIAEYKKEGGETASTDSESNDGIE
tara:strand:- start:80181 stop:80435 length:255 start_codon:yes stop_codon:yes gene_type:complete